MSKKCHPTIATQVCTVSLQKPMSQKAEKINEPSSTWFLNPSHNSLLLSPRGRHSGAQVREQDGHSAGKEVRGRFSLFSSRLVNKACQRSSALPIARHTMHTWHDSYTSLQENLLMRRSQTIGEWNFSLHSEMFSILRFNINGVKDFVNEVRS